MYKLVGTPYKHASWDVADGGIDCIGLLKEYARLLQFPFPFEEMPKYSEADPPVDWFLQKLDAVEDYLQRFIRLVGREVKGENPAPGDILLFRLGHTQFLNHVGIMLDRTRWLNQLPKQNVCVARMTRPWRRRLEHIIRPYVLET